MITLYILHIFVFIFIIYCLAVATILDELVGIGQKLLASVNVTHSSGVCDGLTKFLKGFSQDVLDQLIDFGHFEPVTEVPV